jgi:hypothetical protein
MSDLFLLGSKESDHLMFCFVYTLHVRWLMHKRRLLR